MPVVLARKIISHPAGIRDHHADGADIHGGLGDHLNRGKQPVDVVGALDQHLQLASTITAGGQEVIEIYTTQLGDGSLFYALGVAPREEYNAYTNVFRNVVRSIQFSR